MVRLDSEVCPARLSTVSLNVIAFLYSGPSIVFSGKDSRSAAWIVTNAPSSGVVTTADCFSRRHSDAEESTPRITSTFTCSFPDRGKPVSMVIGMDDSWPLRTSSNHFGETILEAGGISFLEIFSSMLNALTRPYPVTRSQPFHVEWRSRALSLEPKLISVAEVLINADNSPAVSGLPKDLA